MPDLAVEIRSASNWRYDLGAKKPGYERLGLPELWLVDTVRRTLLVYRRSGPEGAVYDPAEELGGSDELTSPQLAGFASAWTCCSHRPRVKAQAGQRSGGAEVVVISTGSRQPARQVVRPRPPPS